MKGRIFLYFAFVLFFSIGKMQAKQIKFDANDRHQTIHSFGASDCWRVQYVGANWSKEKREAIANLLFSSKKDTTGSPIGIALSIWRFNIGTGSHDAEEGAGVLLDWRRSEAMLNKEGSWDWSKQKGQQWFLNAARKSGVKYSLGFSIAPPYYLSKNGKGYAPTNTCLNIKEEAYGDYAHYLVEVAKYLQLDYISPINEPQWDWVNPIQEGTPATNEECLRLISKMDTLLKGTDIKVVFGEAGDIRYLYRSTADKPKRENQIENLYPELFKLSSLAQVVSGHSYWSTYPIDTMITTRKELLSSMKSKLPESVHYWQTEYCPMEKNPDNPNGGWGRDLGINTALYIARVIHYDLTICNASSWQWWTALSQWDYKDGLIFLDDGKSNGAKSNDDKLHESCKYDGEYHPSKVLWAFGNYSRFIRPGMVRLGGNNEEMEKEILYSAYADNKNISIVLINESEESQEVELMVENLPFKFCKLNIYETSNNNNLKYIGKTEGKIVLTPHSVTTISSL